MYQMNLTAIQAATVVASGAKTLSHAIVSALNTSDSIVPSQPPMGTLYSLNDGTHCVAAYNTSCDFGFYVVAPELLATFIEADDNRRKLEHLQLKFPMLELFLKGAMLCVSSGCGDHIEIESIAGNERFSTAVDELTAYQTRIERANCVYHHDPDNLTFAAIIEFSFGKVNVLEIKMQPLLPKVYSLLVHVKIANVGWVRLEAGDINIVWEIFRTVVMQQWEGATMKESDIVIELEHSWVAKTGAGKNRSYVVYEKTLTHSITDSAYPFDDAGKSLAIARAEYLNKRIDTNGRKWGN